MVWGHSWPSDAWNYVQGSGLSLTNQEGGNFKKQEKAKGKKVRKDVQMTNVTVTDLIITNHIVWNDE